MQTVLLATQTQCVPVSEDLIQLHRKLISRVAEKRDRKAFRSLFLHFGPRVKSLMLKGGADHDTAEDIVQDVMTTMWNKVALYDPRKGSVSAWIYTIARNARIDRLRRKSSQPYEDVEALEIASDDPYGEDALGATQEAERVAEALEELPDDQREVIRLAFVDDLSQSEIAEQLGIPLGTVKSRTRLAYGRLKSQLVELQ